jgi:hypothetical protein
MAGVPCVSGTRRIGETARLIRRSLEARYPKAIKLARTATTLPQAAASVMARLAAAQLVVTPNCQLSSLRHRLKGVIASNGSPEA